MNYSHIETKRSNTAVCTGERQKQTEGAVDILGQDTLKLRTAWYIIQASPEQTATQTLRLYSSHVESAESTWRPGVYKKQTNNNPTD